MTIGEHKQCPSCKEWGWFGGTIMNHYCKPVWECCLEGSGDDDWSEVRARDAEEAAERFAEEYDAHGEYAIVSSRHSDWFVLVRKPLPDDAAEGTKPVVERWAIEAETVPQYSAAKVDG